MGFHARQTRPEQPFGISSGIYLLADRLDVFTCGPNRQFEHGAGDDVLVASPASFAVQLVGGLPGGLCAVAVLLAWIAAAPGLRGPRRSVPREVRTAAWLALVPSAVSAAGAWWVSSRVVIDSPPGGSLLPPLVAAALTLSAPSFGIVLGHRLNQPYPDTGASLGDDASSPRTESATRR